MIQLFGLETKGVATLPHICSSLLSSITSFLELCVYINLFKKNQPNIWFSLPMLCS